MLAPQVNLEEHRGDTIGYTLNIKRPSAGPPVDLGGCTLWFTAKRNPDSGDADAVFQKDSTPGGGIDIVDQVNGVAVVNIAPKDTAGVEAPTDLYYDVQLLETDGRVTTVLRGRFRVELDVTRTTT